MEKRRTFLLLVLLAVVAAWAFTIYTQRELDANALAQLRRAARARHFAMGDSGRWQVVEPDESVSMILGLDPSAPAWARKLAPEDPQAEGADLVSAQPGSAPDLLQLRQGNELRVIDCLLQVCADFEIPQGQDLKHPLWISPDRKLALAESGDESGNITISLGSSKAWKALAAGDFRPLVGSEHFSPAWTYVGFEARNAALAQASLVFQAASGQWIKQEAWNLAALDDDGTLHFSRLDGTEELSFEKAAAVAP